MVFKRYGRDKEIGRGQGQTLSAKGEAEFIDALPCSLGDGKDIEAFQPDLETVSLSLGPTALQEFQNNDGAGSGIPGRDTVPEELLQFGITQSSEADDPRGGIDQHTFSRQGASSSTI